MLGPGPLAARARPRGAGARALRRSAARRRRHARSGAACPTAANGSVAPIAPDPSAQLRTIRALRDEDFEVAAPPRAAWRPGPCVTAAADRRRARRSARSTRRGRAPRYRYLGWGLKRMARRLDHRCAVSPDAVALAESGLGGTYELLFNARRGRALRRRARRTPPTGRRSSSSVATSPARASTCCSRRWPTCPPTCACGWAATVRRPRSSRSATGHDPRIEWLGRISDDERSARMRGCTVYCSPSVRGESFGMVLLEAMASGCALVASDLDGHRNVASDGVDALLAPVGDAAALAKALRRVLDDDGAAGRAGGRRAPPGRAALDDPPGRALRRDLPPAGDAGLNGGASLGSRRTYGQERAVCSSSGSSSSSWSSSSATSWSPTTGWCRCGTASRTRGRRSTCSSSAATTSSRTWSRR